MEGRKVVSKKKIERSRTWQNRRQEQVKTRKERIEMNKDCGAWVCI